MKLRSGSTRFWVEWKLRREQLFSNAALVFAYAVAFGSPQVRKQAWMRSKQPLTLVISGERADGLAKFQYLKIWP